MGQMNWFHLITVILVIGKLAGYTTLGWFWVFLPSLFSVAVGLVIVAAVFVWAAIVSR